jgi:uncharacterized membrane protein YecN with MAPEG domain
MGKRGEILLGMAIGLIWAVALVWVPLRLNLPFLTPMLALPGAFVGPGLVLALLIGRLAQRRFFDDSIIDGEAFVSGSPAEIDQRVLTNTTEQLVLALILWPFVALSLGGAAVLVLGCNFALMRLLFWGGYHLSPPLRAIGFAGTFYPTVVAALWSAVAWFL